jgi:hypothetical protein
MAQAHAIDELVDRVDALERCARDLARQHDDVAPAASGPAAVAAHHAASALRTATRRFPLIALAAAFALGVAVAARVEGAISQDP